VRCGSDCRASACCTAGPSSYLGSAPLEEALYRADAMRITRGTLRRVVYIKTVKLLINVKINQKIGSVPPIQKKEEKK
jgi:hypothetical protein